MRVLAMLPVPVVLLGVAPIAAASWIADFETGGVYEDNLSFASMGRDIKGDAALTVFGSAGQAFSLTRPGRAVGHGERLGDLHERYSGLDHVALGVTAAYRRKLGLGLAVPWVRVSASAALRCPASAVTAETLLRSVASVVRLDRSGALDGARCRR